MTGLRPCTGYLARQVRLSVEMLIKRVYLVEIGANWPNMAQTALNPRPHRVHSKNRG